MEGSGGTNTHLSSMNISYDDIKSIAMKVSETEFLAYWNLSL